MTNTIKTSLLILMFVFPPVNGQTSSGAGAVAGSRVEHSLSAHSVTGDTYLASRELRLDLRFPSTRKGKGTIHLVFEPTSGFFFHLFAWEPNNYPAANWIRDIESARTRILVSPERLILVTCASSYVGIEETTEKATSLDDAESKSLKWFNDNLSKVENRTYKGRYTYGTFTFGSSEFPKGYFGPEFYEVSGLPLKLIDVTRAKVAGAEEHIVLTVESTVTHKRAIGHFFRQGGQWMKGGVEAK